MKTLLIGNGYWGSIVKNKLESQTNLLYVANSKDNIDDILNRFDVDYVFVCTPTNTHYEIVKKCISHHKNIFCEKPFTGDFIKANELYKMAE
jgi:predicted dehydrogenase